jgi:hypothetical protein
MIILAKSALTKFYQELPYNAWGHSYRDSIGNITTSRVKISVILN